MYTGSNGFLYTDKNPWGTHYDSDNANFQATIGWFYSMVEKGYMPSVAAVTGQSSADLYGAGKYAMITNGSWMINTTFGYKGVETTLAPPPVGPSSMRASLYNGLADSVYIGSQNKAAAVEWVECLGSPDCRNIVGENWIVFPAIPASTDKAEAAFQGREDRRLHVHRAHQGQDHLLFPTPTMHCRSTASWRRRWTPWPTASPSPLR